MTSPKEQQHQKCGHKFILILLFLLFITLINELILQKLSTVPNTTRPIPSSAEIKFSTKSYYSGPTSKLMNTTYIDPYLIWRPDKNQSNYRFQNETEPKRIGYKIDISQLPNLSFNQYFRLYNFQNVTCFIKGTNETSTVSAKNMTCHCKNPDPPKSDFYGEHCSVPGSIARLKRIKNFPIRQSPKRIVLGVIVNHELSWIEICFRQLSKVVDIFVILESQMTSGGDWKPLYFHNAFKDGFLADLQHKILYIYMESIPKSYIKDGWQTESYLRNFMSAHALNRIENLQSEDLFLSFDADEIPKVEVLEFLKFHDGYSGFLQFNTRWSVFTYYWAHVANDQTTNPLRVGSTVANLKNKCMSNVYNIRSMKCIYEPPLEIGLPGNYAGHHCSWCFSPEGIKLKLLSAQRADTPRWGDFPEKLDLNYIQSLTRKGLWFDGQKPLGLALQDEELDFAPEFVFKHYSNFKSLLEPPDGVLEAEKSS